MHMQINRINVLIITITSQLRNPQPKINFCDFFFINQNSVLNNDNALYDNALKHAYKKIAIFQAYLDDHSGQEQDLLCLTLTTHQGHHMGSD